MIQINIVFVYEVSLSLSLCARALYSPHARGFVCSGSAYIGRRAQQVLRMKADKIKKEEITPFFSPLSIPFVQFSLSKNVFLPPTPRRRLQR